MGFRVRVEGELQSAAVDVRQLEAYVKAVVESATGEPVQIVHLAGVYRQRLDDLRRAGEERR